MFLSRSNGTETMKRRFAGFSTAALACLGVSAAWSQSYVPAIVPTASTTLYTSSTVISPGRVGVDRAGNVFYIAVGGSSSSLMEIPAAATTGSNSAPVTLLTALGSSNVRAVFVDVNGNLWVSTGNNEGAMAPGASGTDYVALVEIPGLNGIPNTALAGTGMTEGQADAAHCTATGTAVCTVLNYKLNDTAGVVAGPQPLDFYVDASGNITYIDAYDNNLGSAGVRVVKANIYNGGGNVLATISGTKDGNAQVAVDGAGNTYYCSPASGKVSLITATGTLTTVGVTSALGAAAITAPTGISGDIYGNLFLSGTNNGVAQLSEVPFEGAALNFVDEFGVVSALTNGISSGGGLDQNGNYYYASNFTYTNSFQKLKINCYNFGSVAVGKIVTSASTPPAPSLNLYANTTGTTAVSSYFPTGSPTTNTTAPYLQAFPYSGTKSVAYGTIFAAGTNYTITMNFEPIHPGLTLGSYTPRTSTADYAVINLQGNGVGPETLFFPGTPSLLFSAAATNKNLNAPQGLAVDTYGDVFVADTGNGKVVANCLSTTTQSEDGTGGNFSNTTCANSPGTTTQLGSTFVSPVAIALDGAQSLYVLDSAPAGVPVTLINGQTGASSMLVAAAATFGGSALSGPQGIAVDGYTNVYIADTGNNRIVKAHQFGATTTDNIVYVPAATTFGGTKLSGPTGLAVDAAQNLYIADTGNNRIVRYTATGVASVIATGAITLNAPYSVAVYPSGQLVVSDKTKGVVLVNGSSTSVLSFGTAYTTTAAKGVALDAAGNIYLSNTTGNQVLELNTNSPQAIAFPATNALGISSNNTETTFNAGNTALVLTGLAVANNNFAMDSTSTCTATSTVNAGSSCTVVTKFTPQSVGPQSAALTLTDNQLSYTLNNATSNQTATFAANGTQALNLSGTAASAGAPQTITFPAPASPIPFTNTPITLSATASSGLPVTFSVLSGPGTLSGNSLTITGVGTIVIAANQIGSVTPAFSAAPQVMQTIVVTQAPQTITFTPSSPVIYNLTTPLPLTATSTSGLAVAFSVVSGPGTISGTSLSITGLGTIVVAASQAGTANFAAAPTVQASIVVSPLGTVATPLLSLVSGQYNVSSVPALTIADATPGAAIYFTVNGTTPTTSSTQYTPAIAAGGGIVISASETVQAIAVLAGYTPSAVASSNLVLDTTAEALTYTINPTSLTLARGQSGVINITVTPQNGIDTTINFGCTGLPIGGTCTFNPGTLTTLPTQAALSTVLTVTAPTTLIASEPANRRPLLPLAPGTTLAAALCLWGWRRRGRVRVGLLVAAAACFLPLMSGCGTATTGQTNVVTVAISGDAVRVTPTFTLIVQ